MKQYLELLEEIEQTGQFYGDRTKVGRVSIFGTRMRFNLKDGFPLLTTKKMFTRGMIEELLWFLQGSSDVRQLMDKNVHIWDQWRVQQEHIDKPSDHIKNLVGMDTDYSMDYKVAMDEFGTRVGSIGPLYGPMWRNAPGGGDNRTAYALFGDKYLDVLKKELASDKWERIVAKFPGNEEAQNSAVISAYYKIDQIQQLILNLKSNPHSSRHVISAWFPELLPDERIKPHDNVLAGKQALPPCHCLFQMYVNDPIEPGGKMQLSCQLYQRSADFPLGVPVNIASYALLTMMIAQCVGMEAKDFIWIGGDTHYYSNQIEGVKEQLTRTPGKLPTMKINPEVTDIFKFKIEDFELIDYNPQEKIVFEIAV